MFFKHAKAAIKGSTPRGERKALVSKALVSWRDGLLARYMTPELIRLILKEFS